MFSISFKWLLLNIVVANAVNVLNRPPNIHKDILLAYHGPAWYNDDFEFVNINYILSKANIENPIVKAFCEASKAMGARNSMYASSASNSSMRKARDVRAYQYPTNSVEPVPTAEPSTVHYLLQPLAQMFCKIVACVPEGSTQQLASVQANMTHLLTLAGELLRSTEETAFYNQLLRQGTLPLDLRLDENLQNIVTDRSLFSTSESLNAFTALQFAKARPLYCTSTRSILLDIALIDFREAQLGYIYELLYVGAFFSHHDETYFSRYRLPRHVLVDENGSYRFINRELCTQSSTGLSLCSREAVANHACNLTTLVGCDGEKAVYAKGTTSSDQFAIVTQIGTDYLVATTAKEVYNVSDHNINPIPLPASGIAKISLRENCRLKVAGKEYPGLAPQDIKFFGSAQEPSWDPEVHKFTHQHDSHGHPQFVIVKDRTEDVTTSSVLNFNIFFLIFDVFREHFILDFIYAQVDVLFLLVISALVSLCCYFLRKSNPLLFGVEKLIRF